MKTIFDATELRGLKLKNRFFRSATWEHLADADGGPTEEQFEIYEELSEGGIGAIITGFTSVDGNDRGLPRMMRLSSDDLVPKYRRLTESVKKNNCAIIAQIALAEYRERPDATPTEIGELSEAGIQAIADLFARAASRAERAGFDGVQIHAAHGFYLSRCISPLYNRRRDAYGGTPEKRARILVDILQAVRNSAPSLHITTKINFHDFTPGGLMPSAAVIACRELAAAGIDSIEVSANGTSRTGTMPGQNEAYFLPFAQELKEAVDTPVILVGGLRSLEAVNSVLRRTPVEYLSLSRPLIRQPDLPARWQNGDTAPATCISCNGCYSTPGRRCVFTDKDKKKERQIEAG